MGANIEAKGQCLCGAVELTVPEMSTDVGLCHCSMCRKWSGGPMFAIECDERVSITGEDQVTVYDSSEWAERGFCARCGTHLFYRLKQSGQYILPAGLLDTDAGLHLDHQIFIDEKPDYYSFANDTHNMTGEEVFAQFSGE